jgi:hypothetical protein
MRNIPIDAGRIRVLVVGEPTPQIKDGAPYLDRVTGEALWNIPVTLIGEFRAESVLLGVPEGKFPKGLGIGAFIIPEGWVISHFDKREGGGSWEIWKATSVKVEGGSAGLKSVAA